MTDLHHFIESLLGISPHYQEKIFTSVIVVIILGILRRIVVFLLWRRTEDIKIRYRWQKNSRYFTAFLYLLIFGQIWFEGYASLTTFVGLVGAGLVIALKDLVASIAGWIFILIRKPFTVGDRVQIGKHIGDVIDVRLFKFSIMEIGEWIQAEQSTGRVLHIANSVVLVESIANYSHGFNYIWDEVPVYLTFKSNWKIAKQILMDIVLENSEVITNDAARKIKDASKQYMIFYKKLTPIVYTNADRHGIILTVRYLVDPRKRRITHEHIWERVLDAFNEAPDIDFAYTTTRLEIPPAQADKLS
jgi:small-conductance mechanosensitive channel